MKAFLHTLWLGASRPREFADALAQCPAPQWGLLGAGLRAALDSILLYLPVALMGRQPSMPSYLTFLPEERYFFALIWIGPLVLLTQWLALSAMQHLVIRIEDHRSRFDLILVLSGMGSLVVGIAVFVLDWLFIFGGSTNFILLGILHLVLSIWGYVLNVVGLKRLLEIPTGLALLVNFLWFLLAYPLAVLIMRAPL